MNSTSSLFQRGGVWTTVCGADLHSCILFSTWEENVHHQIACLRDIKERHSWLWACMCVEQGRTGGVEPTFLDQLMQNLITKKALVPSSLQLNVLSGLMQNYTTAATKWKMWLNLKKRGYLTFHFQHVWISWCTKFDMFLLAAKSAKHAGFWKPIPPPRSLPSASFSPDNKCSVIHGQQSGKSPDFFILPNQTGYRVFYGCGQRKDWTISHVTASWVCAGQILVLWRGQRRGEKREKERDNTVWTREEHK